MLIATRRWRTRAVGRRRLAHLRRRIFRLRYRPRWASIFADVWFEIIGPIGNAQTIATGHSIRELARLVRRHGLGRWRKRKGTATIRMADGSIHRAEVHWDEATGIGRREIKIKRYLDATP
jgi:hypothetical protein